MVKTFDLSPDDNKNTNEIRKDVESYLESSIKELGSQLEKNEQLFNKVEYLYEDLEQNATMGSTKNMIEVANVLSKIRSVSIDVADRIVKAKTSVLTLEQNFKKLKTEETENDQTTMVMAALSEILNNNKEISSQVEQKPIENNLSEQDLERAIKARMATGEIKVTNNDEMAFRKYNTEQNKIEEIKTIEEEK